MSDPRSAETRANLIASFLAASPPRKVPEEIRHLALRYHGTGCLLLFGIVFSIVGGVLAMVFFPWQIADDLRLQSAETASAVGTILSVEETSTTINKKRVFRYTFSLQPSPDDETVQGTCYTTGRLWQPGDAVTIRFLPENPSVACPAEGRLSATPAWVGVLVFIFPAAGIAMILGTLRARRTTLHILRNGVVQEALVTAVKRTNTRNNNQIIYRIELTRTDQPSGPPIRIRRQTPTVIARLREYMEARQPMYILVDPRKPSRVLLPETW